MTLSRSHSVSIAIWANALLLLLTSIAFAAPDFKGDILPLLETYCYDCHGDGAEKGDTSFDSFDSHDELLAAENLWQLTRHNITQGIMPPEKKPQPTQEERALLSRWIDQVVFAVDCEKPKAGHVTMRRLNRVEYQHTVQDLLRIRYNPADDFPPDDTGYGYDTIGEVLSLSPIMLEKYADAAERISETLIPSDPEQMQIWPPDGERRGPYSSYSASQSLFASATIPKDGTYTLRVTAHADQAGGEVCKARLHIDGKERGTRDVPGTSIPKPSQTDFKLELRKGTRTFRLAIANDFYKPKNKPGNRDRNLYIHRVELLTPQTAPPRWLLPAEGESEEDAARKRIALLARALYRRPLGDAERQRHVHFYRAQRDAGETYADAIKLNLQALLVSPNFLFRSEPQPGPISEYQLASRLAYFLWSSAPDTELLDLAEADQLRDVLSKQIRRMLADPKAERLDRHFPGQWLQLRSLDIADPDPKRFPAWNDALRDAMRGETEHLFGHIRKSNRPVTELINADYTYLNEPLARHYGIKGVKGINYRHVPLNDPSPKSRGGILTHASILTLSSYPTRTSPVLRGAWVMETLLGTPPPPPPEDVPELPDDDTAAATASLRDRLESHRDNPLCASCHARIDPIGFGLEHFDAIGAWRDNDHGHPIDATGKLIGGALFDGHAELRDILAGDKADQFVRCLAENLLTYALGRGLTHHDVCAIDAICAETNAKQNRFHALVEAIVFSDPFQKQGLRE